jgi:uncharacterized protein (UPF0548 family)
MDLSDGDFTYREVSATAAPGRLPPAGFRLLRVRPRLGSGAEVFGAAGRALAEWRMHRRAGVRVETAVPRAEPGVRVVVGVGVGRLRLRGTCRVVWVADEPRRAGWAYGTLPGHPECGEEAFEVTWEEDDSVWLTVTAFSRPAILLTRLGGPLTRLLQRQYARRCGRVLRRLSRSGAGAGGHPR